jgi:hypothetical protein
MHDRFAVCVGDKEALRLEVLQYMATHPQVTFSFVVHTVLSHTVLPCHGTVCGSDAPHQYDAEES